ncbi:MAG: hypothetical protein R3C28_23175 [Pirellulaceae bacterium]
MRMLTVADNQTTWVLSFRNDDDESDQAEFSAGSALVFCHVVSIGNGPVGGSRK